MKKTTVLMLLGIVVLGLGAFAWADTGARLRVNIPFAFYADQELMPAGDYIFEIGAVGFGSSSASAVHFRNTSGTVARVLLTNPGYIRMGSDARLQFNKYGSRYFLARVEGSGYQANVAPTKAEKEMRAQIKSTKELVVASGN